MTASKTPLFAELKPLINHILQQDSTSTDRMQAICDLLHKKVSYYDWVGFYWSQK